MHQVRNVFLLGLECLSPRAFGGGAELCLICQIKSGRKVQGVSLFFRRRSGSVSVFLWSERWQRRFLREGWPLCSVWFLFLLLCLRLVLLLLLLLLVLILPGLLCETAVVLDDCTDGSSSGSSPVGGRLNPQLRSVIGTWVKGVCV